MNLLIKVKFYNFLIITVILFSTTTPLTAAEKGPLCILPDDVLSTVVAEAYADYDHPIEFTYLATVAKKWHAIITNPAFMATCKAQGFVEPVMVFNGLEKFEREEPEILKKDIPAAEKPSLIPEKIWNSHKGGIRFCYIDPTIIKTDFTFKGIFWAQQQAYFALWVNPKKAVVFNAHLALGLSDKDTDDYYKSKMSLMHYITQHGKSKEVMPTNDYRIEKDPVTAGPLLIPRDNLFHVSYDDACAWIPTPIKAERFVKKWPSSFKFEKHVPQTRTDYLALLS